MQSDQEKKSIDGLTEAFELFNQTTFALKDAYDKLEYQAEHLSNELDHKNRALNQNIVELEKTRGYLNNILESISDGVIAVDLTATVTTVNKSVLHVSEYSLQEIVGKRLDTIFVERKLFDYKRPEVLAVKFNRGGVETVIERKDGTTIPIILFSSPIYNENAEIVGAVFTFKDLSTIKKLQDQIERSRRLASIGEMAAGVAHEIRNPLGGIEMFASILMREIKEDDHRKMLENILVGVRSINKIVSELLNFTRSFRKTDFGDVDLIEVINSAIAFADVELKEKKVTVKKNFAFADQYVMHGDEDQLKQLFLNVFLNGAQAMKENGGVLEIMLQKKDEHIYVRVKDNGVGIAKENLAKIFDPFFTTKATGNGLGLAISHRIIEAHKGEVAVKSYPDKGTEFIIHFPLG
jgi:PAS domain S-box-containing protein